MELFLAQFQRHHTNATTTSTARVSNYWTRPFCYSKLYLLFGLILNSLCVCVCASSSVLSFCLTLFVLPLLPGSTGKGCERRTGRQTGGIQTLANIRTLATKLNSHFIWQRKKLRCRCREPGGWLVVCDGARGYPHTHYFLPSCGTIWMDSFARARKRNLMGRGVAWGGASNSAIA